MGTNIDSDTHKSGMEPLTERARNLTEVAQVRRGWAWSLDECWNGTVSFMRQICDSSNLLKNVGPLWHAAPGPAGVCAGEDADCGHRRDPHPRGRLPR